MYNRGFSKKGTIIDEIIIRKFFKITERDESFPPLNLSNPPNSDMYINEKFNEKDTVFSSFI